MFAVVEHYQHPTLADKPDERVDRRTAGLVGQTEGAGYRDGPHCRIGNRRKVDIAHAVAEFGRDPARDLDGETRLAGTACTGQRHEPVVAQQLSHLGNVRAATDKAGQLRRKVMRVSTFERTQWRE